MLSTHTHHPMYYCYDCVYHACVGPNVPCVSHMHKLCSATYVIQRNLQRMNCELCTGLGDPTQPSQTEQAMLCAKSGKVRARLSCARQPGQRCMRALCPLICFLYQAVLHWDAWRLASLLLALCICVKPLEPSSVLLITTSGHTGGPCLSGTVMHNILPTC